MEHLLDFIGLIATIFSLAAVSLMAALHGRREDEEAPAPIQATYGPPEAPQEPTAASTTPGTVLVESTVPGTVPTVPVPDWNDPKQAFHLTRVICDDIGLTYSQKNILCACVYQESRFMNRHADGRPTINQNMKDGKVWSTDYGIAQVNDYFHIGPGKTFPSVDYVLDHPEKVIGWMAGIMKATGKLQPWSSYATGAYQQWLDPRSPMWKLKG